jgi:hypothetical protein
MSLMRFRFKLSSLVALIVLGVCAIATAQQTTFAQTGQATNNWSRPLPVSGALPGSWYPSVAATDNGIVSIIWTVTQNGQNTIYFSQNDGVAWSRPIDILIGGLHADLRLDGRNLLHLVYQNDTDVFASDAPVQLAGAATNWNEPLKLSRQAADSGDFLVAPDGTLHAVWSERSADDKNDLQAVYSQSKDGGQSWGTYHIIGDNIADSTRIRLTRGANGALYALWGAKPDGENLDGIAVNLSQDDGVTWMGAPHTLAFPNEPMRQPALAVDKNNALVLVYDFGVKDETFFQVSTDAGATWSDQKPIPGLFAANPATGNDYFALANDSAGRVHLIAVGRKSKDQTSPGVYHLVWDGAAWSKPEELYQNGTFIEFPDIAVSNGNRLHVVFSTRDRNRLSGTPDSSYQIWYTTAETDAPAATRAPLPTFTPQPTDTPTPLATAEPTRRPTLTPVAASSNSSGDAPAMSNPFLPIVVGVAPVLVLMAVVLVLNRVLRHRR